MRGRLYTSLKEEGICEHVCVCVRCESECFLWVFVWDGPIHQVHTTWSGLIIQIASFRSEQRSCWKTDRHEWCIYSQLWLLTYSSCCFGPWDINYWRLVKCIGFSAHQLFCFIPCTLLKFFLRKTYRRFINIHVNFALARRSRGWIEEL